MTKCDFCPYSENKDGKIVCPYNHCVLSPTDISRILQAIRGRNNR